MDIVIPHRSYIVQEVVSSKRSFGGQLSGQTLAFALLGRVQAL